jgi:hypothetical protein
LFASKVKVDKALLDRAQQVAATQGYASVEEFVAAAIEKELARIEKPASDDRVEERLRGLGYIE